jgi:hypothetical protein
MHLSAVAENQAVQFSMGIQQKLADGTAGFLQASWVDPMHGVAPVKIN